MAVELPDRPGKDHLSVLESSRSLASGSLVEPRGLAIWQERAACLAHTGTGGAAPRTVCCQDNVDDELEPAPQL